MHLLKESKKLHRLHKKLLNNEDKAAAKAAALKLYMKGKYTK